MVFGDVERVEVIEISFDLATIFNRITKGHEDIFDALTADRPYRAAMPITKAVAIMSGMVGTQIDANCFAALSRALGRIDETLAA